MLIEDFKKRYTSIPFAIYEYDYKENGMEGIFHLHKEIEILIVLEGFAFLFLENDEIKLEKGNIVFISPYTPHRYKIPEKSNFSHRCICFDASLLYDKNLAENLENNVLTVKTVIKDSEAFSYINTAFDSYLEKKNGFEFFIVGNLSLFFAKLQEKLFIEKVNVPHFSFHKTVIDFIDANYKENITSTDLAKTMHLNNSYFCRLFRKNFGICFQNYLSAYRIEKAKSLLRNTDLSVSEIALKLGFNSISYFTKLFKNEVLLTPTEYRKNRE